MKSLRLADVYKALGIKGTTIPKDMGVSHLNLTITPSPGYENGYGSYEGRVTVFPATGAYAKHRVFLFCPTCGKMVPSGRIAQHHKAHQ